MGPIYDKKRMDRDEKVGLLLLASHSVLRALHLYGFIAYYSCTLPLLKYHFLRDLSTAVLWHHIYYITLLPLFEPTCAHAWWALMHRLLSVCAKILEKKSLEKLFPIY